MANDIYGDSTVTAQDFLASMTVLNDSQMERLRQGEKITLRDVELGQTLSHQDTGDTREFTMLFNVAAAEIAGHLDEAAYLNEDDQYEVRWTDVADIPRTSAAYTHWQSDEALAEHQLISDGMKAKVVVELDHLPDGTETINVVSFIASGGERGQTDIMPTAPQGIDSESQDDSESEDDDESQDNAESEENADELDDPVGEPR